MNQPICVITGVAGLIGSNLAKSLLGKGFTVVGIDSLIGGDMRNIKQLNQQGGNRFVFFQQTVQEPWGLVESWLEYSNCQVGDSRKSIKNGQARVEYVFHFASLAEPSRFISDFEDVMLAASLGTKNATEFATRHGARLILASTSEIYGLSKELPLSENNSGSVNPTGFRSAYNEAKRFAEAWVTNFNRKYSTDHGIVRIFNTYGPGSSLDDTRVIPAMISAALKNQDLQIFGDGQRTRSFCFVDDLVCGISAYADSRKTEPVNLGNNFETKILDLAKMIIRMTNSHSKVVFRTEVKDEVASRIPDLTRARQLLDYQPKVELEEGLFKTIQDLKIALELEKDHLLELAKDQSMNHDLKSVPNNIPADAIGASEL